MLSYLARALAAEGAHVTVITSDAPGLDLKAHETLSVTCSEASSSDIFGSGSLELVRLRTSRLRFWGTWLYMRHLGEWLAANPVDLAYVSMLKHDAYSVIGAGERMGFPVVLRPEGAGFTGDIGWQSWGTMGRKIGRRCRRASAFVAISERIEDELRSSWASGTMRANPLLELLHKTPAEPRIVALPNGVPVPELRWEPRPDWKAQPRASFVGRLAAEKQLDKVIHAWPWVLKQFPQARLVLIGEGPQRPMLEELVRRLGMTLGPDGAVSMPGASADPASELRSSDLFVLPSGEEGMSIALLEAMALGIPVVASSIPGNRRLIDDRIHGRVASASNSEDLARAIIEQWENFDRAIAMGEAARRRVREEFSIEQVARKHLALFRELVENARNHHGKTKC
jgi:glycosyltransferase involved in cell wall biosynthesis